MKNQKGFTLIEVIVVMVILGIMATAGITQYSGFIKSSRDTARIADLKAMETVITGEIAITGSAPTNAEINDMLTRKAKKTFKDPSNNVNACLGDTEVDEACKYEYGQCDGGNGYALRARFEDESRIPSYLKDEYSGEESATDNGDYYELGNCTDAYPADFEVIPAAAAAPADPIVP